jgi:hypothetical protein
MRLITDVIGRTPQIGDRIAYNPPRVKGLTVAIVVGFSKAGLPVIVSEAQHEDFLNRGPERRFYNDTPKTGFVIIG